MWNNLTVIDSHVHYAWPITPDSLADVLRQEGADMVSLAALPGCSRLNPTLDLLAYKKRYPRTTFVFGCLDCTAYGREKKLGAYFVKDVKRQLALGCDGVKLLEGKPTMRRAFPIPDFDDPVWEPFWTFAEESQLPLLWHVNDPAFFWDPNKIPPFAKAAGWGYGPEDVDNEAQYRQVRAVLEAHPKLNVVFAHMFFLSDQLVRLSEWMDRFPNMRVDLAPGIELYENLSKTLAQSKAFFIKYQDRILYGTDIGGRAALKETVMKLDELESLTRVQHEKAFLCGKATVGVREDGHFLIHTEPFVLHGLDLPEDVQQKILRDNFLAFVGCTTPWPVNLPLCIKECARQKRLLRAYGAKHGMEPDLRAVEADKRFFERALQEEPSPESDETAK